MDLRGKRIEEGYTNLVTVEGDSVANSGKLQNGQGTNLTNVEVTGSVTASSFIGDGSALTGITVANQSLDTTDDVNFNSVTAVGTVAANAFTGDGSSLTGVTKANQSLDTTDNVNFNTVTTVGNVTANAFVGDGSGLTGIQGGATVNERLALIDLVQAQALDDFNATRTETNLYGGVYEIYLNGDKVSSTTNFQTNYGLNGFITQSGLGNINSNPLAEYPDFNFSNSILTIQWDVYQGGNFIYFGMGDDRILKYECSTAYDLSTISGTASQTINFGPGNTINNMDMVRTGTNAGDLYAARQADQVNFRFTSRLADGSINLNSYSNPGFSHNLSSSSGSTNYVDNGNKLFNKDYATNQHRVLTGTQYGSMNTSISTGNFGYTNSSAIMTQDGKRIYACSKDSGRLRQFNLTTPYDLSTASEVASVFDIDLYQNIGNDSLSLSSNELVLTHATRQVKSFTVDLSPTSTTASAVSVAFDLSDQLSQAPDTVVLAFNGDVGGGSNTIDWEISDGTNTVTVPHTSSDAEFDCSALTGTTLTVTIQSEISGGSDITINDWALYFK